MYNSDYTTIDYIFKSMSKEQKSLILKKAFKNKNHLVQVERLVYRNGTSFRQHFWVNPNEVKSTDRILSSTVKQLSESVSNNTQNAQTILSKFRQKYNLNDVDNFLYVLMKCGINWIKSKNFSIIEQKASNAAIEAIKNGLDIEEAYKKNINVSYIRPANSNSEVVKYEMDNFLKSLEPEEIPILLDELGIKYDKNNPTLGVKEAIMSGRNLRVEALYIQLYNKKYVYSPLEQESYKFYISLNSLEEARSILDELQLTDKTLKDHEIYRAIADKYDSGIDVAKLWHQYQTDTLPYRFHLEQLSEFRKQCNIQDYDELDRALKLLNITTITQAINNQSELIKRFYQKTSTLKNLLSGKHWSAIQTSLSNVPKEYEQVRTLWKRYEDKFKTKIDSTHGFCYRPFENAVSFPGLKSLDTITTLANVPYFVIFHETSHAIDSISGYQTFSYTYKGGIFDTTLRKEVNEYLKKYGIGDYTDSKYQEKIKDLMNLLDQYKLRGVQDIINGVTYGKVCRGHNANYWRKNKENLCAEAFANITASILTNNTEEVLFLQTHFPNSMKIYMNIINELNKQD